MLISTTTRQTSNCLQIITYHVASFRTNHFKILRVRQSRSFGSCVLLMENLGVQAKSIMVFSEVAYTSGIS